MGSCLSCCDKKKPRANGSNGLREPLYSNKRQSDDISLPKNRKDSQLQEEYLSPSEPAVTKEEDIDVNISALDDSDHRDADAFSDEAIPPMGPRASLTGWLHYKTGTLFASYQRAFFVLQEGYLYTYKRPKSDASSTHGTVFLMYIYAVPDRIFSCRIDMLHDPLDLMGTICDKLSLPDRPHCIELCNDTVLDAYSSPLQTQW